MSALNLSWEQVLVALIAVLALYVVELFFALRHSARRSAEPRETPADIQRLQHELCAMRDRVSDMQRAMDELRANRPNETPYGKAIHLAQQGADSSEVAASCGISRAEAELIVALYRTNSSTNH